MNPPVVLAVASLVYVGMMLGRLPGLALDRTGVAILGAIAMVVVGAIDVDAAWSAIDAETMLILFGLMIVSAQFRLGGFYSRATRWLAGRAAPPLHLLGATMMGTALLSSVLANDVVCLAVAPPLIEVCRRRSLDPVPFLVGLACAANIGSAATLIGNPQNILIGERLELDFARYALVAGPPTAVALLLAWAVIGFRARRAWDAPASVVEVREVPFDRLQTAKAAVVVVGLVVFFLAGVGSRGVLAIGAAGLLLTSRRTASRSTLSLVDWQLLLLFIGLFVVQAGLEATGAPERALGGMADAGVDLRRPGWLYAVSAVASNLVSNVPAVMLLLPAATDSVGGTTMALASTLAGNLVLVGSIANLIVVDQAERYGVHLSWREHARYGIPVTLLSMAATASWLAATVW